MSKITFEEAKTINSINPEYLQSKEILAALEIVDEVRKYYPCSLYITTHQSEDGNIYLQRFLIILQHEKLEIEISGKNNYSKKYQIYYSFRELKNISGSHRNNSDDRWQKRPQIIGVLTTKKIQAWITYYENLYTILSEIDEINNKKKNDFLDLIKEEKVEWRNDNKSGLIRRNGIYFTFDINETSISTRMELDIFEIRKGDYSATNEYGIFQKLAMNQICEV